MKHGHFTVISRKGDNLVKVPPRVVRFLHIVQTEGWILTKVGRAVLSAPWAWNGEVRRAKDGPPYPRICSEYQTLL